MTAPADEERHLPAVAAERVRLALVGEALEVAVHGREPHALEARV